MLGLRQRLIDIPDKIVEIFQADRKPHDIGRDAGGLLLRDGELLMRRGGG